MCTAHPLPHAVRREQGGRSTGHRGEAPGPSQQWARLLHRPEQRATQRQLDARSATRLCKNSTAANR